MKRSKRNSATWNGTSKPVRMCRCGGTPGRWKIYERGNGTAVTTIASSSSRPCMMRSRSLVTRRKRYRTACRVLGAERLETLTIHHGRHTFISHALAGGRTLAEVRDAVGHANVSITSAYLHAAVEDEASGILFDRKAEETCLGAFSVRHRAWNSSRDRDLALPCLLRQRCFHCNF